MSVDRLIDCAAMMMMKMMIKLTAEQSINHLLLRYNWPAYTSCRGPD